MERAQHITRSVIVIIIVLLTVQSGFGQNRYRDTIYKAYSRGRMDVWYTLMLECEKNVDFSNVEQQMELVNLYYGYTAWAVGAEKYDSAEIYIHKSEDIIDKLLDQSPKNATLMAYRGAFIAFEIAISNVKAIFLGPKSMKFINASLELDSESIQGNIEKGNSMYYRPAVFGGDKTEAIEYYIRAIKGFERQGLVINNWMYINTMTALGQAYEATDQIQLAKICYEKIISIIPNFMWVEEELYPDMLKRHNLE